MSQPRSKLPTYLGLAAAGGIGYYLYTAGGSPKAAADEAKHDATKAFPASDKKSAAGVGGKIDNAVQEAEKSLHNAKTSVESYAKETKDEITRGIDKADKKIEEGAAKAKGWFSSK